MSIERADPPWSADETTMLRAWLAYYRATIRRQAAGLTAEQLATPLPPSSMTLGGLLKHLAMVEDYWAREVLMGRPAVEPWASAPWSQDADWEWHSAAADDPAQLTDLYDDSIRSADALLDEAIADGGLDRLAVRERHGSAVSLRWILVHLIEEYARHAGHADLIRESIDGATGL